MRHLPFIVVGTAEWQAEGLQECDRCTEPVKAPAVIRQDRPLLCKACRREVKRERNAAKPRRQS